MVERFVIWKNVKPGEVVWTGIPGKFMTAPECGGPFEFVEYSYNGRHTGFMFEEVRT